MRRNFAQVLAESGVSYEREYDTLVEILYFQCSPLGLSYSLNDIAKRSFIHFRFRDTCISLDDFNRVYGFNFSEKPETVELDDLLTICEYVYNIAEESLAVGSFALFGGPEICMFAIDHVEKVIDKIGHVASRMNGLTVFVEGDSAAIAVAEQMPEQLSYRALDYGHRSLKGDIEGKKAILKDLGDHLEPRKGELKAIDSSLESVVFSALNNANIRHNNFDENDAGRFRPQIASLDPSELESLYNSIYRLLLLANLELDYQEDIKHVRELCNTHQ